MKKIKAGFLGVVMMMFCMLVMIMTPNTALAAVASDSNAVAIVGNEEFDDLQDAINKGGTVKLLDDIELNSAIVIAKDNTVKLDLAGYAISMTDDSGKACYMIKNSGNLTIVDSDEDGTITFKSETPSANFGYSTSTIGNAGKLVVESGTIVNTTDGGASYAIDTFNYSNDTFITIKGGNIVSARTAVRQVLFSTEYENVLTITGGTITGGFAAVQTHDIHSDGKQRLAEVNISGNCVLTGDYAYYTYYNTVDAHKNTDITIKGGTFNGYVFIYNGQAGSTVDFAKVDISDGNFNDGVYVYTKDGAGNEVSIPAISGGTFNDVVPYSGYIVDNASLTVNVSDDITAEAVTDLKNGQSMIINLDNGSISAPEGEATVFGVEKGTLTISGKGTINGDIRMYGSTIETTNYSNVKIDENVVVEGTYGVMLREAVNGVGGSYYGMNLTVDGTINGTVSGIWVMGNILEDGDTNIVTISEDATIYGGSVGLVLAGDASANISGNVSASTESAIEVRAGKLTVLDGAEIMAESKPASSDGNLSGTTTIGAGIAIAQHSTKLPIDVVVKGGTISAHAPIYQSNPQNNDEAAINKVQLSITGGTYEVINDGTQSVYSKNFGGFVSGGLYSLQPSENYIASGYKAAINTDGMWEIVPDSSVPVMFAEGNELTVYVGEEFALTAVTTPVTDVRWELKGDVSYDEETGRFTATGSGRTTWVKAWVQVGPSEENTTCAKCTIKILKQELSAETLALATEEQATLTVSGTYTKGIKWSSADTAIATVDQNGKVTAVAAGTTTIKAVVNDALELTCIVTVSKKEVAGTQGTTNVAVTEEKVTEKADQAANDAVTKVEVPENVDEVTFKEEVTEKVNTAIKEVLEDVLADIEGNTASTQPTEGLAEAAAATLKNQELEENEKALVYVNVVLEDVDVDVTTTVGEDNKVTAEAAPTKLTFKVEPFVKVFKADGSVKKADEKIANEDLNGSFKVRLPIPKSITDKYATIVHRSTGYADQTYTLLIQEENGQKFVEMTLTHFSTFEVSFTNTKPSSGSSRSYTAKKKVVTGTWVQNEIGWWYRNADGTWPAAQWVELEWNGQKAWYYFNAEGYMHSGWLLDGGNWYFLHNVADGTQGYMYTGWHQIDGKWYYFNPVSGGPKGSLLVNTVTPDGYTVDANGAWVQ